MKRDDVTQRPQNRTPEGRWTSGTSGNPGGMPKGLRSLQGLVLLAHGPKILTALQKLFELGMDPAVDPKTRVAALTAFVGQTGALSGLAAVAKADAPADDLEGDEEALLERVVEAAVRRAPELVAAKLELLTGGKP